MRKVHHFVQGSPEWKAHRATPGMFNGSEIAAIMGIDPKTSRSELLRMKALGGEKEFSDYVQKNVIDKGHEYEALARPLAEELIGDDLSPLVITNTVDGLLLSVSLDGITQGYDTTFEHKSLNQALAAALDAGTLPEEYEPQCEAGLMASGATRCLFMASKDGDMATARHYWYESKPALRPRMIAACKQFEIDRINYVHVNQSVEPTAATIEALPALFVQVEGKVLATNLDAFKAAAQSFIDGIRTELVTDQHFADADKMVKFLKDGEDRLAQAKQHALAQTASIDELFRTVDAISEQMRSKRLALGKLVAAEKENRRAEIIRDAQDAMMKHIDKLNERVGGFMPRTISRFAEAIKGLKSLDSMRDKVSTALANAKLEANEIAATIDANRNSLLIGTENDTSHLFPDFAQVCTKAREDFAALHAMRIQQEAVRKEAEREKIRQEEAAKLAAQAELDKKREEAHAYSEQQLAKSPFGGGVAPQVQAPGGPGESGTPAAASTPPDHFVDAAQMVAVNENMIDDYLRLLGISAAEKKALRGHLVKFESYRIKMAAARGLAAAA